MLTPEFFPVPFPRRLMHIKPCRRICASLFLRHFGKCGKIHFGKYHTFLTAFITFHVFPSGYDTHPATGRTYIHFHHRYPHSSASSIDMRQHFILSKFLMTQCKIRTIKRQIPVVTGITLLNHIAPAVQQKRRLLLKTFYLCRRILITARF